MSAASFPEEFVSPKIRNVALCDYLTRAFAHNVTSAGANVRTEGALEPSRVGRGPAAVAFVVVDDVKFSLVQITVKFPLAPVKRRNTSGVHCQVEGEKECSEIELSASCLTCALLRVLLFPAR